MNKKKFAHLKMKFSIQEAGGEKQIFFTFKDASEKTGITSKNILRVLKSGRNKYFRRSDKKTFWIQNEEKTPFIQKFRRDLEFLERFFLVNFVKRKLTSWIRRKNLMKLRGNLMIWRNLLVF